MGKIKNSNILKEDLKFLGKLEKRLHSLKDIELPHNMGMGKIDEYSERKIIPEEMEKLKEILSKGDYVIFPKDGPFGFYPCFEIDFIEYPSFPILPIKREQILSFSRGQLPTGESFDSLSKYFMDPKNLKLTKKLGIEFENDESRYDY